MPSSIEYSDVEEWLDDELQIINSVERVQDRNTRFNVKVHHQELALHVFKSERGRPLELATRITLRDEMLATIRGPRRQQFMTEVESVLTTTPGVHAFTDESGQSVPTDEFTTVTLRHWIYPDGASQHTLMTAVIDMLTSLAYIRDTANRIHDDAESHR